MRAAGQAPPRRLWSKRAGAPAVVFTLAVALLFSGAMNPAGAQTATTGVVQGTVTDPQGALVIGAEVKLLDTATNLARTQMTGDTGQYVFTNVLPGTYSVTVTMQGFRTSVVPAVRVEVNRSYTVNFTMEVGDLTEVVQVDAGAGAELQTFDAQIGNVLEQRMIRSLPTLQRNTIELLSLQPATTPGGFGTGGTVSGARSDQNTLILDGIDVSDNLTGGQGISFTQAPVGVDAVDEFRVTVANPNASFGRSAGGQIAMSSPRGGNELHGVAYWYHQNDNLNANTWTRNRLKIPKSEMKDNRAGVSVGGPFWRERTFFFSNYEVRRFPQSTPFTRLVPTNTLRNGILTFRDATGTPVAYPLATTTACGPSGGLPCDPRGLGISPTIQQLFASMPAGNDPTLGDGLNTIGFRGEVPTPLTFDTVTFRADHKITEKMQFMGRYSYQRNLSPLGGTSQLDIRDPNRVVPLRALNTRGASVISGVDYTFTPTLIYTFRFGWVQNKTDLIGSGPSTVASMLGFPGTNSSIGGVGLDLVGVDEPIEVTAQAARTQIIRDRNIQFNNHLSWVKGSHTFSFGGEFRSLPFLFTHNDQVTFLTGPVAQLNAGSFLTIPAANRPPTCGGAITTNCIRTQDVSQWNNLYAGTLGLVDNVNIVGARDGNLNPLPFGTDLITDTTMRYYQFHFQDTWRLRPSLTLTYGLTYSWLTPPKEALNRIALVTDRASGEVFTARGYLGAKRAAALQGQVYNPEIGVRPIADSGRKDLFDTDYSNVGPRVAAAWSPSFDRGLGRWLLGNRRGAVRGGFGIVYDRVNTVSVILPAAFGIGFGQVLQLPTPLCNASSSPGPGCDPSAGAANRALSSFRVGHDGSIPIPPFAPATSPIVPAVLSGGVTYATDPERKVGRNYVFDLTVQRELPGNMVLEVGYIGRLGRDLPIGVDLDASPYFFTDPASGQSFAQAFDNVACVLRGDAGKTFGGFTCPASVQPQPWFENQLPGLGTAFLTSSFGSLFQTNNVSTLFLQMNVLRQLVLGLPPYNNLQLLAILMATHGGVSNYHAAFFTLRNRPWHGLLFDVNYTLSKSLDQAGNVQNSLAIISTGFDPWVDYGAALSDRRHVFNSIFQYELPFGAGRRWSVGQNWLDKVVGGWYLSGIFRAFTSLPYTVTDNAGVFGGSLASINQPAIPLVPPGSLGAGVYSGVAGSGGVGTTGNPATGGSGLNLFADPQAAFNSFRRILLSQDGRTGQANHFRGPGFWNLDLRVAKETRITERVSYEFSFDFFNVFNHVNLATPSLSLNAPASFGVFTAQFTPPNRTDGARWIQFGSRIRF